MDTDDVDDVSVLIPRLVLGETAQAILTAVRLPAQTVTNSFKDHPNALALRNDIQYVLNQECSPDRSLMCTYSTTGLPLWFVLDQTLLIKALRL